MFKIELRGFVINVFTNSNFKSGAIKTTWIMNGIKCTSWSKTIAKHLENGMEVSVIEAILKTETWPIGEGKTGYADNRVEVSRLKLHSSYEENEFVGIDKGMKQSDIDNINEDLSNDKKEDEVPWELDL